MDFGMLPKHILLMMGLIFILIGCVGGDRFTATAWSGIALDEKEELLYISTGNGKLKGFHADTGKQIAEFPSYGSKDDLGQFYSAPTVSGDWVFVASYQDKKSGCGPSDEQGKAPCGRIYGLKWIGDGDDRRLHREWVYPRTREHPVGGFIGSPAVAGNILVVGSSDKNVYAINTAENGKLEWVFEGAKDKIWSTPTIAEGVVYFGSLDHNLYAVDLTTGEKLWSYSSDGAITSRPVVKNGILYFGSFDKHIYALDVHNNGNKLFDFPGDDWFWADLVTDGELLYAGTLSGTVYGLNLSTLQEEWEYPTDVTGGIVAAPVLAGDQVGVFSDEGYFVFFNADDGEDLWNSSIEEDDDVSFRASPISYGDSVVVMKSNCSVHRLNWKISSNRYNKFDWIEKVDLCE